MSLDHSWYAADSETSKKDGGHEFLNSFWFWPDVWKCRTVFG